MDATAQDVSRLLPFEPVTNEDPYMAIDLGTLRMLPDKSTQLPPYWSTARDRFLREVATQDVIATAVSLFTQKLLNVPFAILPKNGNIQTHVRQAASLQEDLFIQSGLLAGWEFEIAKFVKDYLTQDNGGFLHLMGAGRKNGPIEGQVAGVFHLDAARCTRTGDPEFPVTYLHPADNKLYKIHFTRVIAMSAQPSPNALHFGVGLCHLSSCLRFGEEIDRIVRYYAQKMGYQPARQILYVKKGATLDHLQGAVNTWRAKIEAEGNDLFASTLLVAPKTSSQELDLAVLDLASTPDGFDRQQTVMADNAIVAAAFGLDLRDFGYMTISSERSSEAAQQKGYSRGVATFIKLFDAQLRFKVVPPHLTTSWDYVDDMQDQLQAGIQETRARTRSANLTNGTLTVRIAREQMKGTGELTDSQFNDLELADGRLPNGLDVISLFSSEDPSVKQYLDLGVENPLDPTTYDALEMLDKIEENIIAVQKVIDRARTEKADFAARCALAALTKLQSRIMGEAVMLAQQALSPGETALTQAEGMEDNVTTEPAGVEDDAEDKSEDKAETQPAPDAAIKKELADPSVITTGDVRRLRNRLRKHTFLTGLFEADVRR